MEGVDLADTSAMERFLEDNPRGYFSSKTIIRAMEVGNPEVVRLMVEQNIARNKEFSVNLFDYAIEHNFPPKIVGVLIHTFADMNGVNLVPMCGNDLIAYIIGSGLKESDFPPALLQAVSEGKYSLERGIEAMHYYRRHMYLYAD